MIKSVKMIKAGEYLINEFVKMFNIDMEDDKIVYDIDFDEKMVTEDQAVKLCEEFLKKAVDEFATVLNNERTAHAKDA